jgi:hypothetical protein
MVCRDNPEFYMADRQAFRKGMAHDEAVATQRSGKIGSPPKVRNADFESTR